MNDGNQIDNSRLEALLKITALQYNQHEVDYKRAANTLF